MTDPNEHATSPINAPGLLDDEPSGAVTPDPKKAPKAAKPKAAASGKSLLGDRRVHIAAAAVALVAGGTGAALWWMDARVEPPRTVAEDGFVETMEYAFLSDDFNKLSVEERLAIIRDIIAKLRDMGQQDSLLMAMFASLIAGEAREQMMENVSRLAVDSMDELAMDYNPNASDADRREYLEEAFVTMEETLESLVGIDRTISGEERLERGQRRSQREMERAQNGGVGVSELARGFDLLNNEIGAYANGHQKQRIGVLMRDMIKVMRRDTIGGETEVPGGPVPEPEAEPETRPGAPTAENENEGEDSEG